MIIGLGSGRSDHCAYHKVEINKKNLKKKRKKNLKKKFWKKNFFWIFFCITRHCMEFQSRVVTWSCGIVWIFNVWWKIFLQKKFFFSKFYFFLFFLNFFFNTQWSKCSKLCQIFTSLIRLVKPLGNDIPCIALVMVRITFPGGGSNVPQRLGWNNF